METEKVEVEKIDVDKVIQEELATVDKDTALDLKNQFSGLFSQAADWTKKAKEIKVTGAEQVDDMKLARTARLELKNIRVESEKRRKSMKAESLRKGKAIDGMANIIKFLIVPVEEHLKEQEEFAVRVEAEALADLIEDRAAQLAVYEVDTEHYNLDKMSEAGFTGLLEATKVAWDRKKAGEKRAEEERIAADKAEEEERERIKAENARLKAEAEQRCKDMEAERERVANEAEDRLVKEAKERGIREAKEKAEQQDRDKLEAQREAKEKKEREVREAKEKAEQKKRDEIEAARRTDESAERKKQEAKLDAEKKEREKAEAALQAKKDEEARIQREVKEAQREAKLAPDKRKLEALAATIAGLAMPDVTSAEAKLLVKGVVGLLNRTSDFITEKCVDL